MEKNNNFLNSVMIFDSSITIEKIKRFSIENMIIYSLDYESHIFLKKNKVEHEISDELVTENDLLDIQNKSYYFTEWAKNNSEKIIFEGINLGNLSNTEFHYMLVPLLKKTIEIKRIIEKNISKKIISSSKNIKIVKQFTTTYEEINNFKKEEFLYDTVKIPLPVISKSKTISLSNKNYKILSNLLTRLFLIFSKSKNKKFRKTILFVEFDIVRFRSLFEKINQINFTPKIFNRRRPYVWNTESFSLLRKLNCEITKIPKLTTDEKKSIENERLNIKTKFQKMISNKNFSLFFNFNEIDLWSIIENEFFFLYNMRFTEAIHEIILAKKIFLDNNISHIVIWSEIGFNEQIIIGLAKKNGIGISLLQHGMYYETHEALKYNSFNGILPEHSKNFLTWGKITKNYAEDNNFSEKAVNLGSPLYDQFFSSTLPENEEFILLTTTSPTKNIVTDLKVETNEKYENTIKEIIRICKNLNKKLIIKIHPFQNELNLEHIIKNENNLEIIKYADTIKLIKKAVVIISIDLSTTLLEAIICGKPAISVSVKNYPFGTPKIFEENGCINSTVNELERNLKNIISNEKIKNQTKANAKKFLDNYLSHQGKSSTKIIEFLNKELNY